MLWMISTYQIVELSHSLFSKQSPFLSVVCINMKYRALIQHLHRVVAAHKLLKQIEDKSTLHII